MPGGAGTVYVKGVRALDDLLVIDAGDGGSGWTRRRLTQAVETVGEIPRVSAISERISTAGA